MKDKSKYRMIADGLKYRIECGELVSGSKFYTRQQLCELFRISPMTAFQVQRTLQEKGLIAHAAGQGFFVNRPEVVSRSRFPAPLKKVRMIGSPQAVGEQTGFGSRIVAGAKETCAENGLQFRLELVQVLENPAHVIDTSRHLDSDEGLILYLHEELLPEVVNLLLTPQVRAVLVNRTFPDMPAVLTDMRHAASETMRYLRSRNVKRILYAGQCSFWTRLQQESEFYEAFREFAADLSCDHDFSGSFYEIAERIRRTKPDAVVFSDDNAALHLRNHYLKGAKFKPLLTGVGGFPVQEKGLASICTYREDAEELGRGAVRLLMRLDDRVKPPLFERVKGKLLYRSGK